MTPDEQMALCARYRISDELAAELQRGQKWAARYPERAARFVALVWALVGQPEDEQRRIVAEIETLLNVPDDDGDATRAGRPC